MGKAEFYDKAQIGFTPYYFSFKLLKTDEY